MSTDRNVIVNYKRKNTADLFHNIYYGKYDLKTKKVVYVDVTYKEEFNLLLTSHSTNPNYKHQNIGFLLFVNTACPSVAGMEDFLSLDFDLTATPLYDIRELVYADVSQQKIHTYSSGFSDVFFIAGRINSYVPGGYRTLSALSYDTRLIGDSVLHINNSFTDSLYVGSGKYLPASISKYSVDQEIIYNFISGRMELLHRSLETYEQGAYYDDYKLEEVPKFRSMFTTRSKSMVLENVFKLTPVNAGVGFGDVLEFKTANTLETRQVIRSLTDTEHTIRYDAKGEVISTTTNRYLNTDYSGDKVTMRIWLRDK